MVVGVTTRLHRGHAVSVAERRIGGGVCGGFERVDGLEDGARGETERGEVRERVCRVEAACGHKQPLPVQSG